MPGIVFYFLLNLHCEESLSQTFFINPFMTEPLSYRNQSIESMNWFLYNTDLLYERVNLGNASAFSYPVRYKTEYEI